MQLQLQSRVTSSTASQNTNLSCIAATPISCYLKYSLSKYCENRSCLRRCAEFAVPHRHKFAVPLSHKFAMPLRHEFAVLCRLSSPTVCSLWTLCRTCCAPSTALARIRLVWTFTPAECKAPESNPKMHEVRVWRQQTLFAKKVFVL